MFGILSGLSSVFSFLGGIAPAIAQGFAAKQDTTAREFISMSETERSEYSANQQAVTATNTAKTVHGTLTAVQILTFLFGIGPAIHFTMTYLTATFPQLGFHTDPMLGVYAESEVTIAKSFFILTPTLPIVQAVTARLFRG